MSDRITQAILDGAQVSLSSDCWPVRGGATAIQISMTKRTGNGTRTLNRTITREEIAAAENPDDTLSCKIRELAEKIDSPWL